MTHQVPYDDDFDDVVPFEDETLPPGYCPWCGEPLFDDVEAARGYHHTAPCFLWATGKIQKAIAWERAELEKRHRQQNETNEETP
jgi:hypothetical protein